MFDTPVEGRNIILTVPGQMSEEDVAPLRGAVNTQGSIVRAAPIKVFWWVETAEMMNTHFFMKW